MLARFRNGCSHSSAPDQLQFATRANNVRLRPDHSLVFARPWVREAERVRGVARLVGELAAMAA